MGRKQDQAVSGKTSKLGVGKQVEQGHVRKQQHGKSMGSETIGRGPLKSKAGFTLYSQCSDTVKQTKPAIHKSLVNSQKQTQGEKKAEDRFLQQPEVVSQMQIQNELTSSAETSSIIIPTGDAESSRDSTWYGNLDHPEFGTPFNKRLVSSTPDPESLLEAELMEHHMNQSSVMCPQVIPERDTTHPSKATETLTTVAGSLIEKLKIQRQQCQENKQLLQQTPCQPLHNQWQQQYQHPVSLNLQDDNAVLQKPFQQQAVHSSELLELVPTPVLVAEGIGDHDGLKRHTTTTIAVDYSLNSQQGPAMWHTSSHMHQSLGAVLPVVSDTRCDIVSVGTQVALLGTHVSKVTSICPPENTQSSTIPCLSQPKLANDNINKCSFVKVSSPKYKTVLDKAAENSSPGIKHCETAKKTLVCCEPASAFSKSEICAGTQNCMMSSYLESSTVREITFPESGTNIVENNLPDPQVSGLSTYKEATHNTFTHNPGEKNNLKCSLAKETKNNSTQKADDPDIGNTVLSIKSKTIAVKEMKNITHKPGVQNNVKPSLVKETKNNTRSSVQSGNPNKGYIASPLKPQRHIVKIVENLGGSLLSRNQLNKNNLDTSSDTCDMEVNNVLKECKKTTDDNSNEGNLGRDEKIGSQDENVDRMSVASVSSNLSHVIAFLKTNAFNQATENESERRSIADNNRITDAQAACIPAADSSPDIRQPAENEALAELMREYLPETVQNNVSNNSNKHVVNSVSNTDAKSRDLDWSDCDKHVKSKDPPGASGAEEEVGLNINQNHFRDEDSSYEMLTSGRVKNLQYLERMADPALRDVTCRLALKATALRDIELRDLIDEMILLTDASLRREDARFQSAQVFFAEENSKLKKRIQTVNQQLDAKERQEKMGTLGHSDNDVLHLERKLMYLRDEKEKLDNQVTMLLEEKAKWLITQQDLVRTISLKDHELLKVEEKHHEEKKSLLHSLDQATQNSQGVHYKLSVADKEISNLEQCTKSRNMEIMSLKEKLKEADGRLKECERLSKFKSQEILHLQDLVDALKIGVGHVLQAYESSSSKDTTTVEQRQGMENLRQMVHPEEYRSMLTDPDAERRKIPTQGPHHYRHTFSSSQTSSLPKESKTKRPFVRQEHHPNLLRDRIYQRHHTKEGSDYRTDHYRQHKSRDDELDIRPQRLTSETLKEHNKRLSPVNKCLWRSLDHEPKRPPSVNQDPYYSDSEIEVNGRSRRRSSFYRHGTTAGNLHRQFTKPHSRLPHGQSQASTEWYPRAQRDDNDWDMIRRSLDTTLPTLESETIPKSGGVFEYSLADPLSEETYYSTLRSEPIPEKPYMSERKPVEASLAQESCHPRSFPVTYPRPRQKFSINRRNGQHHSLRNEYGQITGSSVPENSWDVNDQEAQLITLQPSHLSHDGHGNFQHDVETFPKTVHEVGRSSHPHHVQENPFTSVAQPDKERLQSPNQSMESGGSAFYMSQPHSHRNYSGRQPETAQFNDTLEHPSLVRQSVPSNDIHSIPNESSSFSDISLSRRATKNSDSITQREFFQGTELSASLSTISEVGNNQLKNLNEDPFSSGIASLDEKIADLQRKIDRTKAMYS